VIYDIAHVTEYRFVREVELGLHRLTFRPRDGHDMRVLATSLLVQPTERRVDLIHDAYGNSVALVLPGSPASTLRIESRFTVDHVGSRAFDLPFATQAQLVPPAYSRGEQLALMAFLLPSHDDANFQVREWAQQFVTDQGHGPMAQQTIQRMSETIRNTFEYRVREEEGTQTPQETLTSRSGSCRDLATLMIDALRRLGIAARFVSGYLYSPQNTQAGTTHAWVQIYLPDCGWFPVDPTNNLIGGSELIRVAVAREAAEVSPLSGAWYGASTDFAGMTVQVSVTARPT
jgi:transglutaminase-like putative cysteine protease